MTHHKPQKLIVGLTGGIGSGKSTVADLFREQNVLVIDADQIARLLVEPGQPCHQAIVQHFGQDILLPEGGLNRAALRTLIFQDAEERHWLEGLLHPKIQETIVAETLLAKGPYCIVEIPLLIETQMQTCVNRILAVDCSVDLQISRVRARDQTSVENIQAIIHTQAPRDLRLQRADDCIHNDGDHTALRKQVLELHEKYLRLSAIS